jgi:hypothetical protein
MGLPRTYPDGSVLTSSAITQTQMGNILQPLVLGMLGLTVSPESPLVRISWPTEGAPSQLITDDICYLRFLLKDDPYDKIRERFNYPSQATGFGQGPFGGIPFGGGGSGFGNVPFGDSPYGAGATASQLNELWSYTRVWDIHFCAYGPNSFDNLRAVRSALYQDYFLEQLQLSQLFPMSEFREVMRVPELFDKQWWERSDFSCEMYEFVEETITRQTVISVEVVVEDAKGTIADFVVQGS